MQTLTASTAAESPASRRIMINTSARTPSTRRVGIASSVEDLRAADFMSGWLVMPGRQPAVTATHRPVLLPVADFLCALPVATGICMEVMNGG